MTDAPPFAPRGLTVCVGEWYAALLTITLPRAMRHMAECWVITSPDDLEVRTIAGSVPGVKLHLTDAFTRHGARFNKGLAVEECFEAMGRSGWFWVWDADCVPPNTIPVRMLRADSLHGLRRRVLEDPAAWSPDLDWSTCPKHPDGGPVGFSQIFHADAILGRRPWYDVSFGHGGGCDAYFMSLYHRSKWRVLPADCLHLGQPDRHWFGADDLGRSLMARFVTENGWGRAASKFPPGMAESAPSPVERVEVPGYPPSGFELPFVRRARKRREQA